MQKEWFFIMENESVILETAPLFTETMTIDESQRIEETVRNSTAFHTIVDWWATQAMIRGRGIVIDPNILVENLTRIVRDNPNYLSNFLSTGEPPIEALRDALKIQGVDVEVAQIDKGRGGAFTRFFETHDKFPMIIRFIKKITTEIKVI